MGGGVIAQGLYFNVDSVTNVIQNFYYMNNNQYVDILLPIDMNGNPDNIFTNNNFTEVGVSILSVIPYFNQMYNTPYKLLFQYINDDKGIAYIIYYKPTAYSIGWNNLSNIYSWTFTSIAGLPPLSSITTPRYMGSMFSNNAQVYYKSHTLSTGSGGVRNCRQKQRRT
jgi:hypothetical protein